MAKKKKSVKRQSAQSLINSAQGLTAEELIAGRVLIRKAKPKVGRTYQIQKKNIKQTGANAKQQIKTFKKAGSKNVSQFIKQYQKQQRKLNRTPTEQTNLNQRMAKLRAMRKTNLSLNSQVPQQQYRQIPIQQVQQVQQYQNPPIRFVRDVMTGRLVPKPMMEAEQWIRPKVFRTQNF